jgi:hypothetical protein
MSLAHLRALKSARPLSTGASAPEKPVPRGSAYCGAHSEPIYRTVDEATESGLELCASCLATFRRQRSVH